MRRKATRKFNWASAIFIEFAALAGIVSVAQPETTIGFVGRTLAAAQQTLPEPSAPALRREYSEASQIEHSDSSGKHSSLVSSEDDLRWKLAASSPIRRDQQTYRPGDASSPNTFYGPALSTLSAQQLAEGQLSQRQPVNQGADYTGREILGTRWGAANGVLLDHRVSPGSYGYEAPFEKQERYENQGYPSDRTMRGYGNQSSPLGFESPAARSYYHANRNYSSASESLSGNASQTFGDRYPGNNFPSNRFQESRFQDNRSPVAVIPSLQSQPGYAPESRGGVVSPLSAGDRSATAYGAEQTGSAASPSPLTMTVLPRHSANEPARKRTAASGALSAPPFAIGGRVIGRSAPHPLPAHY